MAMPKPERIKERLRKKVGNTLPIPNIYLVKYSIIHRYNPADEVKHNEIKTLPGLVDDIDGDYDYKIYDSKTNKTTFVKSNYRMPHLLYAGHPIL